MPIPILQPNILPTRFGWFWWDGKKATVDGTPLPLLAQASNVDSRGHRGYEGLLPLENGASLWLFAELDRFGLWEVATGLWLACPRHRHGSDPERGEYWAVRNSKRANSVTQTTGCAGAMCPGCCHYEKAITGDPGDVEEFWAQAKEWGSLRIVNNTRTAPHDDCFGNSPGRRTS